MLRLYDSWIAQNTVSLFALYAGSDFYQFQQTLWTFFVYFLNVMLEGTSDAVSAQYIIDDDGFVIEITSWSIG